MRVTMAEEIDREIISNPALLYLYRRIEQILGIKAPCDGLVKLNEYLEQNAGAPFVKDSASYERILALPETMFTISRLLTVNETYFFREGMHFNLLLHFFLPQLCKLARPIQICSAAASIGCEAYSLAMLLDYYGKEKGRPLLYEIDAFDINAEAIETAKSGRYTANTLRTDGAEWGHVLDSYLVPDGGELVVSHNIRERVRFFTHNVMDGFKRRYDIIFFRNALIYFSAENRQVIADNIAGALFNDGVLFLGTAETSSINHPLLLNRFMSEVFYFQKIPPARLVRTEAPAEKASIVKTPAEKAPAAKTAGEPVRKAAHKAALSIDCAEVAALLAKDDGASAAQKTLEALKAETEESPRHDRQHDSALAAAALVFLSAQNFDSASPVLKRLESGGASAFTGFLRGEYHYLCGNMKEAEEQFQGAASMDRAFWPAFYRLCSLAADGNRTRYEYKIKKALESLALGRDLRYECFIGGFSPDYFRLILEKKLEE